MECTADNHPFFRGTVRKTLTRESRLFKSQLNKLESDLEKDIYSKLQSVGKIPYTDAGIELFTKHFHAAAHKHFHGGWTPDFGSDLSKHIHTGVTGTSPHTSGPAADFSFDDLKDVKRIMDNYTEKTHRRLYPTYNVRVDLPGAIRNIEVKGVFKFDTKDITV